MSTFGIELLAEEIGFAVSGAIKVNHDMIASRFGWTPIESLFFCAFRAKNDIIHLSSEFSFGVTPSRDHVTAELARQEMETAKPASMRLFPQCHIDGYRVDFLIGVKREGGSVPWLVVECDGHDFHERTKEQAAKDRSRDRDLQAKGYRVFRFTGSELYRKPLGCASETWDWLRAAYFEDAP